MNINISNYDINEIINIKPISDRNHNKDVDSAKVTNDIFNEKIVQQEKEKIFKAVTMDVNEVKNFLFMLIGAGIKLKPENNHSGMLINRLV